jgi:ribosome-associated protein
MMGFDFNSLHTEVRLQVQRSRGPGGQNVNKRNTSVQLWWSVQDSALLSEQQKLLLLTRLANQLTQEGCIFIRADAFRDLEMNKKDAFQRLILIIQKSLHVEKPRKKTKPTYSSKLKSKKTKENRSEKKSLRRKVDW